MCERNYTLTIWCIGVFTCKYNGRVPAECLRWVRVCLMLLSAVRKRFDVDSCWEQTVWRVVDLNMLFGTTDVVTVDLN